MKWENRSPYCYGGTHEMVSLLRKTLFMVCSMVFLVPKFVKMSIIPMKYISYPSDDTIPPS